MLAKNIKEWHKEVCKNGRCEFCGIEFPENMLAGHHVKTKGSRPDLKLDVDNGVCVCDTPTFLNENTGCHNLIHNKGLKYAKDRVQKRR